MVALVSLWLILLSFAFRLAFGVALSMGVTSSKLVTSGFFRVHLWVLMGLGTVAALVCWSSGALIFPTQPELQRTVFRSAIALAIASYIGAVLWLYERDWLGKRALAVVAGIALYAGISAQVSGRAPVSGLLYADWLTSGLLLGSTTTAMLLGHWYLNTPTMKLDPLKRLLGLMAFAILARAAVSGFGLALEVQARLAAGIPMPFSWQMFLLLRWTSALVAAAVLCWLTWLTLKIPNTQSATGILYAGVILVFIGELTSQLLSLETAFPV